MRVQIGYAPLHHAKHRRGARQQRDRDAADDPGEAHAADRGGKEFGIVARRDPAHAAVREQQLGPQHVVAEAAMPVVILPVHVGGDGATERGEGGARGGRRHEAARHESRDQVAEGDPGLGHQNAGARLERDQPVKSRRDDRRAAVVERGIAIAARAAERDDAGRNLAERESGVEFRHAFRPPGARDGTRSTAPAREDAGFRPHR
jgi:hypothetical protein